MKSLYWVLKLRNAFIIQSTTSYKDTLYFNDGIRRIDMVLAYEDDLDFLKEQRRKTFLRNLTVDGLEIEMENPDPTKRVSG